MNSPVCFLLIRRVLHTQTGAQFLKIGNVRLPVRDSKNKSCVPKGFADVGLLQKEVKYLKWLIQKDLLKQDAFIIGMPGSLRLDLVLQYLELSNREFEYLSLTRDTTESDIKQRREIRSGNAFYTDLCAVRAALNGRVLVIDGVEKAERNVLPLLNNLLENREMQLDDGRFLMSPMKYAKLLEKYTDEELRRLNIEPVSDDFRVIALGLPVPSFKGHSLDPPFRSRFQCLNLSSLPFDTVKSICEEKASKVDRVKLNSLLGLVYGINLQKDSETVAMPLIPIDNIVRSVRIWNNNPFYNEYEILEMCYPTDTILRRDSQKPILQQFLTDFGINSKKLKVRANIEDLNKSDDGTTTVSAQFNGKSLKFDAPFGYRTERSFGHRFASTDTHETFLTELALMHSVGNFCILGPKGSGKTTMIEEFGHRFGYDVETIAFYQDMNSRDLMQSRRMLENGDTVWDDSQLVRAAKAGDLCVLDGLDRVHWSTAEVLAPLIHSSFLHLPDGTRLISSKAFNLLKEEMNLTEGELNERGVFSISPRFRIVALANSESAEASGTASKWLNDQLLSLFLFRTLPTLDSTEKLELVKKLIPNVDLTVARKLFDFVDRLNRSHDANVRNVGLSLSFRRLMFILESHSINQSQRIYDAVHRSALARFLPNVTRLAFEKALEDSGITAERPSTELSENLETLIRKEKPSASQEAMIPDILFYENDQHLCVMNDMANDFKLGAHLLLIGNQGVGKNKITDRFLQRINRPRQYMQLHRDTTVQSLTMQTTVVDGVLKHEDSALVNAVRNGLILIVDEADKAPLHVIAVLKSLMDCGVFYLSDGRRIQPPGYPILPDNKSIVVHPDFRMIMLANRPGFPFLGNDLFGVLGDLFSVHVVDNPDAASEIAMLRKYGPNVPINVIEDLVRVFSELRSLSDNGQLSYPYSTRELVNIIKHLELFGDDPLPKVVRNVFDFDAYSKESAKTIEEVFRKNGIPLEISGEQLPIFLGHKFELGEAKFLGQWGVENNETPSRIQRTLSPINFTGSVSFSPQIRPMEMTYVRAHGFSEQAMSWQLDIGDGDVCSDILVLGERLIVSSVNPPTLHIIPNQQSREEYRIPLTGPMRQGYYRSLLSLNAFGDDGILVHDEVANALVFVNLRDNVISKIEDKNGMFGWEKNVNEKKIHPDTPYYAANMARILNPKKSKVILSNGLLISALPLWETPEKALAKGFLEVVNINSKNVQYIPVPTPISHVYFQTFAATISDSAFVLDSDSSGNIYSCDMSGGVRKWEVVEETLSNAYGNWRRGLGIDEENERLEIQKDESDFDLSKLDTPKFGKLDPKNTPHSGGNTWAGGTGGYNTAGLGGVGGPFRLDAGHDVSQISQQAKDAVPEEIRKKARAIAQREYAKRLKEIDMSAHDANSYREFYEKIVKQVTMMKNVINSLEAKEKERQWAKHQTSGDLDDGKLIEGMTGEKTIYRKRMDLPPEPGAAQTKPKRLRLLVDVSGSMYRFNGHDKRLQKSLETTLMVMEALDNKREKIEYDIVGHSGESPEVIFSTKDKPPTNEKERLNILKKMLAHSQFCYSGDYTLEAIEMAAHKIAAETEVDERFIIALSDANIDRYGIEPKHVSRVLSVEENVNSYLILIGSLGPQAERLRKALPAGKAFIANSTAELPNIIQQIFSSTLIN